MKKIAALAVIFSMIVVFSGCRNNNSSCRWSPFKKDQTVCYTPCNSCDIPVVDDCCPCDGGMMAPSTGCSSCAMGGTTVSTASIPTVEPIPGN